MTATAETIPLFPRRRLLGSASGGSTSIRRGGRADVASSRPYHPGDPLRAIDWKSSARLSSARARDEFIVRERFAEELPTVVLVVDRRPEMALYDEELPWLSKPAAMRAAARILAASAVSQRALVAYVDDATWEPPRAQANVWSTTLEERVDAYLDGEFAAPENTVQRSLEFLGDVRGSLPIGTFVFVLSDFTAPTPIRAWAHVVDYGWDVIPVIVQDPVWEQSFPQIDGVLVSLADARGRHTRRVRLDTDEVAARRAENQARLASLRSGFLRLDLDPVLLSDDEEGAVHATLLAWTQTRVTAKGRR
ncbi:MAG TPA: DUF58 domain-containing protein [Gaiellaceae bacterium]|nr:DUF58 domain-containing protein [Gaiellaceae bacterium]